MASRFGALLDAPKLGTSRVVAPVVEDLSLHDERMMQVLRSAAQRPKAEGAAGRGLYVYLPTVEEVYRDQGVPEEGLLSDELTSHALYLCNAYTGAAEENLRSLGAGRLREGGGGALPLVGLGEGSGDSVVAALRQERSLWRLMQAVLRVLPLLARVAKNRVEGKAHGNAAPLGEGLVLERETPWGNSLREYHDPHLILLGVLLDWLHTNACDDATALLQQANETPRVEGRASLAASGALQQHHNQGGSGAAPWGAGGGGVTAELWRLARCGRLLLRGAPLPPDGGLGALQLARQRGAPWLAAALCAVGPAVDEFPGVGGEEEVEGTASAPSPSSSPSALAAAPTPSSAGDRVRRRGNPSRATTEAAALWVAQACSPALAIGGSPFECSLFSCVLGGESLEALLGRLGEAGAREVLGTWEDALWVSVVSATAARCREMEGAMDVARSSSGSPASRVWVPSAPSAPPP